jgi:hypothetical protein
LPRPITSQARELAREIGPGAQNSLGAPGIWYVSIYLTARTRPNNISFKYYTRKNAQVVAILMKTGLNSASLPTLFTVVNNIEQYCYTRFRLNNVVQYCWQVWTTWAAKHCSILLNSGLGVFCRVCFIPFSRDRSTIEQTQIENSWSRATTSAAKSKPDNCSRWHWLTTTITKQN